LNVGTLRGLRVVSHGGSWAGYRGHFLRFPDQRFGVATFCNLTTSGPDTLARKVAGVYLAEKMQPDSAAMWTVALAGAPATELSEASLKAFSGVWRNVERGEVRRTRLVGDTLFSIGGSRTRMDPLDGGRFRAGPRTEILFAGTPGAPSVMIVRTAGDSVSYTRADTAVVTPAQLAAYAGEYRNDEVEATHSWKIEKGELVVYANNRRLGTLDPSYKDGFTRGGSVIDVQRDSRGRITGYIIQAGRVRNLRFTRVR
ncbi:MAG: hypothetical protein ACREOK_16595, partial [Gemmatimonadaceae bacterium]